MALALQLTAFFCFSAAFNIDFIQAFCADYKYVASTRSYYKYHDVKKSCPDAKSTCESEDAVLFHPETEAELSEVLSQLNVIAQYGAYSIFTGISDEKEHGVYRTLDGHPINQVFNKWFPGEPQSKDKYQCGVIRVDLHLVLVRPWNWTFRYICKHQPGAVKTTAIETISSNASHEIAELEGRLANQTTKLEVLAANQAAASERLMANQSAELKVLEQEVANQSAELKVLEQTVIAMKLHDNNQPSVLERSLAATLERIAESDANQATALSRLTEVIQQQMQQQTKILKLQGATMERQALALEKLANPQEEISQ